MFTARIHATVEVTATPKSASDNLPIYVSTYGLSVAQVRGGSLSQTTMIVDSIYLHILGNNNSRYDK